MRRGLPFIVAVLAACGTDGTGTPGPWNEEANHRWRELPAAHGTAGFTEMQGRRSGVTFQNTVSDSALVGDRKSVV